MPLTFINWLLAFAPVLTILVLMLGFRWGGSKAGAAGWFVALIVAWVAFGATPEVLGYAQAKSVLLTLDVLMIIWAALLLFHVADQAGAVQVIGDSLPGLTSSRAMQALLLSWIFVSFLQGVGGFGVPVAVVAPLLVGMGFAPIQAVLMASIGHGWAVSFGSLATSYMALLAATGVDGLEIAPYAATLLGIAGIFSGAMVAYIGTGFKSMIRALPAILILGVVMGVVQGLLAMNGLWTLGATGGSLVGLVVAVLLTRIGRRGASASESEPSPDEDGKPTLMMAIAAYLILIVLAFSINLIPPLEAFFDTVTLTLHFPELTTRLGWVTPAEPGRSISMFGHAGTILLYASLIAYAMYQRAGYYKPGAARVIADKVVKGAVKGSLGIAAMVGMAVIMGHAGMTNMLARGLSESVGPAAYPAVAPFIGALGAFMTGSNTNSNVVFGALQQATAVLLSLNVPLILAAQTAGGALGSVFAPAKVIVGSTTVGLSGQEGLVIGKIIAYGLILVAIVAVITLILAGIT